MKKIKEHPKTTAAVVGGTAAVGLAGGAYLMDRKGRQLKTEGVDRGNASYFDRQSMNVADARENIGNRFSRKPVTNQEANDFGNVVDMTPEQTAASLDEVTAHAGEITGEQVADRLA